MMNNLADELDQIAHLYDRHAVMQNEVAERLIEHLNEIQIQPKIILNLGAKTGYTTKLLNKKFSKADIISLEVSEKMLLKIKQRFFKSPWRVFADLENLPFKVESFDLIFSNLALHEYDCKKMFTAVFEILQTSGLFLLSTFGNDVEMQVLGDTLLQLGYTDPVLQTEQIDFIYKSARLFIDDLKKTGYEDLLKNAPGLRYVNPGHISKQDFKNTFEIIYGQAWKKAKPKVNDEVIIPVSKIRLSSRD